MGATQSMDVFEEGEMEAEYEKITSGSDSIWDIFKQGYNTVINTIVRPPRREYSTELLGPTSFLFRGTSVARSDFRLRNKRGYILECSHWKPDYHATTYQMPCVIYLHGNASCRAEALQILPYCLSVGCSVFSFDFSGSGLSEGAYISLGHFESEDVDTVVDHLLASGDVAGLILWGRSIGAAATLLHLSRAPPQTMYEIEFGAAEAVEEWLVLEEPASEVEMSFLRVKSLSAEPSPQDSSRAHGLRAELSPLVRHGDRLVSVDGTSLLGCSVRLALTTITRCRAAAAAAAGAGSGVEGSTGTVVLRVLRCDADEHSLPPIRPFQPPALPVAVTPAAAASGTAAVPPDASLPVAYSRDVEILRIIHPDTPSPLSACVPSAADAATSLATTSNPPPLDTRTVPPNSSTSSSLPTALPEELLSSSCAPPPSPPPLSAAGEGSPGPPSCTSAPATADIVSAESMCAPPEAVPCMLSGAEGGATQEVQVEEEGMVGAGVDSAEGGGVALGDPPSDASDCGSSSPALPASYAADRTSTPPRRRTSLLSFPNRSRTPVNSSSGHSRSRSSRSRSRKSVRSVDRCGGDDVAPPLEVKRSGGVNRVLGRWSRRPSFSATMPAASKKQWAEELGGTADQTKRYSMRERVLSSVTLPFRAGTFSAGSNSRHSSPPPNDCSSPPAASPVPEAASSAAFPSWARRRSQSSVEGPQGDAGADEGNTDGEEGKGGDFGGDEEVESETISTPLDAAVSDAGVATGEQQYGPAGGNELDQQDQGTTLPTPLPESSSASASPPQPTRPCVSLRVVGPVVRGVLLDSVFTDLYQVIHDMFETARRDGLPVPSLLVTAGLSLVRSSIRKLPMGGGAGTGATGFDIKALRPGHDAALRRCTAPCVLVGGSKDDFVRMSHAEEVMNAYGAAPGHGTAAVAERASNLSNLSVAGSLWGLVTGSTAATACERKETEVTGVGGGGDDEGKVMGSDRGGAADGVEELQSSVGGKNAVGGAGVESGGRAYRCLVKVEGDHDSPRPHALLQLLTSFVRQMGQGGYTSAVAELSEIGHSVSDELSAQPQQLHSARDALPVGLHRSVFSESVAQWRASLPDWLLEGAGQAPAPTLLSTSAVAGGSVDDGDCGLGLDSRTSGETIESDMGESRASHSLSSRTDGGRSDCMGVSEGKCRHHYGGERLVGDTACLWLLQVQSIIAESFHKVVSKSNKSGFVEYRIRIVLQDGPLDGLAGAEDAEGSEANPEAPPSGKMNESEVAREGAGVPEEPKATSMTSFCVFRRYHDFKLLFADLSAQPTVLAAGPSSLDCAGQAPSSQVQAMRNKLVFSSRFSESRLVERREVFHDTLQLALKQAKRELLLRQQQQAAAVSGGREAAVLPDAVESETSGGWAAVLCAFLEVQGRDRRREQQQIESVGPRL